MYSMISSYKIKEIKLQNRFKSSRIAFDTRRYTNWFCIIIFMYLVHTFLGGIIIFSFKTNRRKQNCFFVVFLTWDNVSSSSSLWRIIPKTGPVGSSFFFIFPLLPCFYAQLNKKPPALFSLKLIIARGLMGPGTKEMRRRVCR